jgi:thioredoxin-related protein
MSGLHYFKTTATIVATAVIVISAQANDHWLTNYRQALRLSKSTGKPILADFNGSDWCSSCIMLKRQVFDKPEFKAWAKLHVVLLDVDYPQHKRQSRTIKKQNAVLWDRYSVGPYPDVLFLNSNGKQRGELGYLAGGPKAWISAADRQLHSK